MALTKEQVQRLRQMPPEARRAFHTNRIATSLEAIEELLRDIRNKLDPHAADASIGEEGRHSRDDKSLSQ